MTLLSKLQEALGPLKSPTKAELKDVLLKLNLSIDDLPLLPKPNDGKPYNRKLLYKNDEVEMLVMNWCDLDCAPHDHGDSHGWIQVLSGASLNTVYEVKGDSLPTELFHQIHQNGTYFFAPKKGIHKMQASNQTELVTLHLYSPPITNMMVYDLTKCAACVVSDDCGAWWPDNQKQKLKEIKLKGM
jgi:cysteine dioxygenase